MNYAIANLHGDYDRYQKMLGKIALKEDDTLYVLGNVLDPEALDGGMKLFQDMALRPNVIPILGRNEFLASITLGDHGTEGAGETEEDPLAAGGDRAGGAHQLDQGRRQCGDTGIPGTGPGGSGGFSRLSQRVFAGGGGPDGGEDVSPRERGSRPLQSGS